MINKTFNKSIYKKNSNIKYNNIINNINNKINYTLIKLTPKKLKYFIIIKYKKLTYKKSTNLLNLKINNIQNYIKKTKIKIKNKLKTNLFI